jgi:T-complex protein 1 subunit alpha
MFQRDPRAGAFLGGDRISGQDVRDQNGAPCLLVWLHDNADFVTAVIAAQSIANIIKSSLGPLGLDKMLVDNIGVRLIRSHARMPHPVQLFISGSDDFQ